MFGLFDNKDKETEEATAIAPNSSSGESVKMQVFLNARLQPAHRASLEKALVGICKEKELQVIGLGGETTTDPETGEASSCTFELELGSADIAPEIVQIFEVILAPKGSTWNLEGDEPQPFGTAEGMALRLDVSDLPKEEYEAGTASLYEECNKALSGAGAIVSNLTRDGETILYIYGSSFKDLVVRIQPLLESHPLCQKSRLEQIA